MKRHEGIAYGPVAGYAALLAGSAAALGWAVTSPWYPLAILFVPLLLLALYRLLRLPALETKLDALTACILQRIVGSEKA